MPSKRHKKHKTSPAQISKIIEAKWSGALSALTKYLPPLIRSCVAACAVGGLGWAGYNHFSGQKQIDNVWEHSGNWRKDISDLQFAVFSNKVGTVIRDEPEADTKENQN